MSDSESAPSAPHPTVGGKTLQSIERPRYKSWRKKYRKIRHRFDGSLEENKRLFREEQKLEQTAKRLREELDGLRDLCLDLNNTPAIPPALRFDLSHPLQLPPLLFVPEDVTPEAADEVYAQYHHALQTGEIGQIDLHLMRQELDNRLARQGVESLDFLEKSVPHNAVDDSRAEPARDDAPSFLTPDQETEYLTRLDAKLDNSYNFTSTNIDQDVKHWAELTPREFERQMELLNPQSQHNWLKVHAKANPPNMGVDAMDDTESLASHDNGGGKSARKRTDKGKNLAKQVGERAMERAREGWSPSAASGMEDDELGLDDGVGSSRKKGRETDGTYRFKGGKGGGSKGKRKRSGEDIAVDPVSGKKARMEAAAAAAAAAE